LRPVGRKLVVPPGDLGLLFQPLDLRPEFLADVGEAGEVVAGVREPMLGFAPPLLVLGHSRRFLEKHAQFLGPRLDDARNHPLLDDGVRTRAQARAEKNVLHVAAAHMSVVDEVGRFAVPLQYALYRDLGVLGPLTRRPAEAVVEEQLDARPRYGLSQRRAVEDHVLHRVPAQGRRARFPEYQRTASMMFDFPHPFGPTTPTSCPGTLTVAGSTKDLNPASLIWVSRTLAEDATNPGKRRPAVRWIHRR